MARPPARPTSSVPRGTALSHAARWVGATGVALLALILWVEAGSVIGPGWVMIGATATVAVWASVTVTLAMSWLMPDRPPAWVELARVSRERGRDLRR